ncbi:amino acid ABC transporter ATP-binding protein [Pseudoxanthobacter sp.]|uniref:amino acid ABC transporter ATP-binding protein n=1 Tax=Pseudoxanthobacter sp. TaxID=1925742 RepID=UPI002FE18BD9
MSADTATAGATAPAEEPLIRVEAISKAFAGRWVVDRVSFTVARGEVVCVLGPSGSGKSTMLRCLNWLAPPESGAIRLAGERLGVVTLADGREQPLPPREIRRQRARFGMVFQQFNLWPHRTALQNVMEGLTIVRGLPRDRAREVADAMLDRVGLAARRDAYPAQLSGGQQQRVAIARALAMEPEILLFDEPTSALDPELVGEVLAVMQDLARRDVTMIVVTHEMGFAANVADRILFMDQGRVVEEASPQVFFSRPATDRARRFLESHLGRAAAGPPGAA